MPSQRPPVLDRLRIRSRTEAHRQTRATDNRSFLQLEIVRELLLDMSMSWPGISCSAKSRPCGFGLHKIQLVDVSSVSHVKFQVTN